jgi:hypothetical protein
MRARRPRRAQVSPAAGVVLGTVTASR